MEINHRENAHKGSFYIEENGALIAEMTYNIAGPGKMILEHTNVSDQSRGHGVGNLLADAAVSYSRDNNLKIIPLCSFERAIFNRTPAYDDVLLK
ncbi:GNAT family N-acetyltransferase [Daejeonella sp.]|uniref:GNAT family N-acetyltransferase n=1 Tax=Daejeonella sp. TaxID=2805397 RepID=UPI0030BE887C